MTATENTREVIVIGAGFAGVYGVWKLREAGFDVLGVEAGDDVGGTWYWNRYPGLRCDVDSLEYCYAFSDEIQQEWTWTERYATQREIHDYIRFAAEKLGVRKDIRFNSRVASAIFDERENVWTLSIEDGTELRARYLVMGTGSLSIPKTPDIAGIDDFGGELIHSVDWPEEMPDLSDKNVAVIGTGSTGVQMIPLLAQSAKHLTVVQRTPAYVVPARNREWPEARTEFWRENFRTLREQARQTRSGVLHEYGLLPVAAAFPEERVLDFERRWQKGGPNVIYGHSDILRDEEANETISEFLRDKIREAVDDPQIAEKLTPRSYPVGTKRICVGTDYYETYNRDNVTLLDLKSETLERIEAGGIRTEAGFYPADVIVLATGYDAMTGALLAIDIRTSDGRSLREDWRAGPLTYLGLAIAGYPNLFVVSGPGSPSVFSNMVLSAEHDVEWIADCLSWMREKDHTRIEPDPAAQEAWMDHVDSIARSTLVNKAASWYRGANVEGKPQKFMPYLGGVNAYQDKCRKVAEGGYEGFVVDAEASDAGRSREMASG